MPEFVAKMTPDVATTKVEPTANGHAATVEKAV